MEKKHNLFFVSQNEKIIKARGDYKVVSDYDFSNHPFIDVLIISGGVHTFELEKIEVMQWIKKQNNSAKLIASVCTGAFLLAKSEVIKNQKVTTHWEDIEDLRNMFPSLDVIENVRWVDENKVVTSAGISAGIDMSLFLISKLYSQELAYKTAKQMQFDWTKNSKEV